jgi:hypothetical protein
MVAVELIEIKPNDVTNDTQQVGAIGINRRSRKPGRDDLRVVPNIRDATERVPPLQLARIFQ